MSWKIAVLAALTVVWLFEMLLHGLNARSVRNPVPENVKDVYDPETYAKLPAKLPRRDRQPETAVFNGKEYEKMPVETPEGEYSVTDCFKGMNDAANEFFGACKDMGLTLDKEPEVTDFVQEVPTEENVTEHPETTEETVTRPMQVVAIRSRVRPDCRWEVLADGDMVLCNGGFRMSEARVIQIRPLANSGAPIWDYMSSDYPDRIKMPMEDGRVITYWREIEQPHPQCQQAIHIIRNMEVGYERK